MAQERDFEVVVDQCGECDDHSGNRHGSDIGLAERVPNLPHHRTGCRRTNGLGDCHRHRDGTQCNLSGRPVTAITEQRVDYADGGEPGGDSRPSPPDGYSFVSYHGEMPRARLEGEVDAGGARSGPDIENVFPDARLLLFDTDNAVLQAVAGGEARDNGGESHARNA